MQVEEAERVADAASSSDDADQHAPSVFNEDGTLREQEIFDALFAQAGPQSMMQTAQALDAFTEDVEEDSKDAVDELGVR
jgi:hypothetical protein